MTLDRVVFPCALLVAALTLPATTANAAPSCKDAIAAAKGELLVCKQGGSTQCTFPKFDELVAKRKRCMRGKDGKALTAYHAEVVKLVEGRRAEAQLARQLQGATESVKLAKVGELADTMSVANGAKASLKAHRASYGAVSAKIEGLAKALDAALASRQPELLLLAKKRDLAKKSLVSTGRYTLADSLRPDKVAEAWTLVGTDRVFKVAGQMNSSLQQFVWSPGDAPAAQVPVKGDRSGVPTFELAMIQDKASMRVVVAWAASTSIGTPLLIWDAPLDKDYFIAVTPDAARFRIPYVTVDGPRTYKTVEPMGTMAKPRFRPFRQMKVPSGALADLGTAGVLDADRVTALTAAASKAEACYGAISGKLKAKAQALYSAQKTEAADKLTAVIADKAMAKCKRHIKPIRKLYKKLMKQYWLARVAAFEKVKSLFTVPAPSK